MFHSRLIHLLLTLITFSLLNSVISTNQELLKGFTATPDPSISTFQPLLIDSSGNYSLSFLRVDHTHLALAVIHVPSAQPVWVANMARLPRWATSTRLSFNGSLVITESHSRVVWSSDTNGDRVWLSNTSNLLIEDQKFTVWQSFQFPSDTLMETQNFTSAMVLISSNGLYSMRLGPDFIGYYAKFNKMSDSGQIYLHHNPLEAKANVIEGEGPIYIVLNPDGFLGMYQNGSTPVDVQAFNTFQQPGSGNRRVRLENDGNFNGYYWNGSSWLLDYQAISDPCELPSACGSYGLCQPGKGCSCLDNRTDYTSGGRCMSTENNSGDFCGLVRSKNRVLRKTGVELPFKEIMGYEKMDSLAQCEKACETNCTCWGAVYSNSSGFCYILDYPIQTLVKVGDETKMGYFKVREDTGKNKKVVAVGIGVVGGVILVFCGILGLGYFRFKKKKRGVSGYGQEDGVTGVGPYKDLASVSFRSIELSER